MKRISKILGWIAMYGFVICLLLITFTEVKANEVQNSPVGFAEVQPENKICEVGSKFDIKIRVSSRYSIVSFDFISTGFELMSNIEIDGDNICFTVLHQVDQNSPELQCKINLSNGEFVVADLYGVVVDGILALGEVSHSDTEQDYASYLATHENTTDFIYKSTISSDAYENHNITVISEEVEYDTRVYGSINYRYDGNIYPLQYFVVEAWDMALVDTRIATDVTDEYGNFSLEFVNGNNLFETGNTDVRVIVKPQGEYVHINHPGSYEYGYVIYEHKEIGNGEFPADDHLFDFQEQDDVPMISGKQNVSFETAVFVAQAAILSSKRK